MNHLKEMREIECDYKDFYESVGLDIFDGPLELEEFRRIIDEGDLKYRPLFLDDLSDMLQEDVFFHDNQDVAVFQHYRYMPAIYHEHAFFELAYVLAESCTSYIGTHKTELSAGDIFILPPHTRHAICTYSENGVIVNILIRASTFERHFLNLLPNNDLLYDFFVKTLYHSSDIPYLTFKTGKDPQLTSYVLQLHREYMRNKRYKNTMITSLLSVFFVILLRNHEKDVMIPGTASLSINENTIFILQYMQKHYSTITLSHLAKFFNYSERQIQRIITAATGMGFSENIKKLRMAHAAQMLENSGLTVREIAECLGYYDASNFRQLFKKCYHKTPLEYRNEARKRNTGR